MQRRSLSQLRRRLSRRPQSDGFALIATIWALGLITLLATAAIVGARYRTADTSATSATTRASLAAESAVHLAIAMLVQQPQNIDAAVARFPLQCKLPGRETAFISVEDESGKIDLNAARPQLVTQLFFKLSGNADDAARISDRIVRFRQANVAKAAALASGEKREASAAKRPIGGFASTLQLDQAADLPPSLFRAALPFVTVRSGRPEPLPETATADLRLLLGIPAPTGARMPKPVSILNFTIRADIASADGARFIREAVVSFGREERPFEIHEWRRGDADLVREAGRRPVEPVSDCLQPQ